MPQCEFFCHACKKFFDKILSPVDYEEGNILCPHCGSVFVITSKKSARTAPNCASVQPGSWRQSQSELRHSS
jgi:DNA-directed RNA polymerase subunit RPC12/RpoP